MDPLSGAASVVSIVSLVVQVTENVKKLQEFFNSLENAPQDVWRVQKTLETLSIVLNQLEVEATEGSEDQALRNALLECQTGIEDVQNSVSDLAPAFISSGKVYRTWASLKTVSRAKLVAKLEDRLEKAKTTLTLALQSSTRRLQLAHHHFQRLALAQAFHNTRLHEQPETKVITTSLRDHVAACRGEVANFTSTVTPWIRPQLDAALQTYLDKPLEPVMEYANDMKKASSNSELKRIVKPAESRAKTTTLGRSWEYRETIFGKVRFESVISRKSEAGTRDEEASPMESCIVSSKFSFAPSSWLAWLGLSSAVDVNVAQSTHTGWKINLSLPRIQPDNAPVFELCTAGNIDGIRNLIAQGKASVLDVDSRGSTPLHIAAGNHHPNLCQALITLGANVHTRDWSSWSQSPFSRACCDTKCGPEYEDDPNSESRQIQTFRKLLSQGLDLQELDEDQHILRIASFANDEALERNRESKTYFEFPSQWILKQMLPDILEDPSYYDFEFWEHRLSEALLRCPGDNPSSEILPYCDPKAVRVCLLGWCRVIGSKKCYAPGPEGSLKDLKAMLEKIETLNYSEMDFRCGALDPDFITTPTRQAMRRSNSFQNWTQLLKELKFDMEDFAANEAPLLDDGWSTDNLLRLLQYDYVCPDQAADKTCAGSTCNRSEASLISYWEPLWDQHVQRLKQGLHPAGPFTDEEVEVHRKWKKYVKIYVEHGLCYFCQRELEEEQSSGLENHPGLVEIDV